jgi:hypothetical protein
MEISSLRMNDRKTTPLPKRKRRFFVWQSFPPPPFSAMMVFEPRFSVQASFISKSVIEFLPEKNRSCPQHLEETPMRAFIRPVVTSLSIACLAVLLPAGGAFAQGKMAPAPGKMAPAPAAAPAQPQLKQMALTDKQVDGAVAASKEMDPITAKLQPNAKPDPKVIAQLEGVAKKNGFASYQEYNTVMDNIGLVFNGVDPATKKYVGTEAVIKSEIAEVQADKKMSPKDKKAALDDLNASLKEPGPEVQNKGNIDLVVKNYDKLTPIMGDNQN